MNRLATFDENLVNEVRQRSLAELARICGEAAALSLTNSEIHDEFLDACLSVGSPTSVRSRILKDGAATYDFWSLMGFTHVDPFEDTESATYSDS